MTAVLLAVIFYMSLTNFSPLEIGEKTYLRSKNQHLVLQKKLQVIAKICLSENLLATETCKAVQEISQKPVTSLLQPITDIGQLIPTSSRNLELNKLQSLLFNNKLEKKYKQQISELNEYQEMLGHQRDYDNEANSHFRSQDLLTKGNFKILPLFKAQFIHGGYGHLIGNVLFFVFLSIFVELRLGAALYSILYIASGTLGMSAEILMMKSSSVPLVGASANIAGVAGAFTVFFWRKRMKIFASAFFAYNRIIALPVYFFFPVLVFSGDLVGSLSPVSTGVAHIAHMGGFLLGAAMAFLIQKTDQLPSEFCFEEEFKQFQKVKQAPKGQQLELLMPLLDINPENTLIHQRILSQIPEHSSWEILSEDHKKYVVRYLPNYILFQKRQRNVILDIISKAQIDWPLKRLFASIPGPEIKSLLQQALDQRMYLEAEVFLKILLLKFPKLQLDPVWIQKSVELKAHLQHQGKTHEQPA